MFILTNPFCLWSFISESIKGSDSEDDFTRKKKKKIASDSDSDSDRDSQRGGEWQTDTFCDETRCSTHRSSVKLCVCVHVGKKPAANDLFGEADDISSDSDAEKPLTPGQPMVRLLNAQHQKKWICWITNEILQIFLSHLSYAVWNMIKQKLW